MNADSRVAAVVRSLLAAALGYVVLWIVLEGGKIAFGKKRVRLDAPKPFTWTRHGDDADFIVGEEQSLWSDYFAREKDKLLIECDEATIDHRSYGNITLEFHYNRVRAGDEEFVLDTVDRVTGIAREIVIPREAMGRGDLKFLAAIGAFAGWRAVLFSIFVIGKRVWSAKLPFGPYLAAGALIWIFFGDWMTRSYVNWVSP
jgi:leader peptidase (prepilin peptidase)/N-methyltransferase